MLDSKRLVKARNTVFERYAARPRGSALRYAAIRPRRFGHIFARRCSRKRRQQQTLRAITKRLKLNFVWFE